MQKEETVLTTAELERVQEFKWTKVKTGTKLKVIPTTTYSNTTLNDLATPPIIANEPTIPIPTVLPNTLLRKNERQQTLYELIQHRREQREVNKAEGEKRSDSLTKLLEQPKTSAQNALEQQTIHAHSKKQSTQTTYCSPDESQATLSASYKAPKILVTQLIEHSAEPATLSNKGSIASRFGFAMT